MGAGSRWKHAVTITRIVEVQQKWPQSVPRFNKRSSRATVVMYKIWFRNLSVSSAPRRARLQLRRGNLRNTSSPFTLLVNLSGLCDRKHPPHVQMLKRESKTIYESSLLLRANYNERGKKKKKKNGRKNSNSILKDPRKGACVTLWTFSRRKPLFSDQTSKPGSILRLSL